MTDNHSQAFNSTSRNRKLIVRTQLPVHRPFAAANLLEFFAQRAIGGMEVVDVENRRYCRSLELPNGPGAVDITLTSHGPIPVSVELTAREDLQPALGIVRRLLDLDVDPKEVTTDLAAVTLLRPSLAAAPGIRVPGTASGEEMIIRALIGQQISVHAARGHLNRLVAQAGTPYDSGFAGITRCFPSPAAIVAAIGDPDSLRPDRVLRLPRSTTRAVHAIMTACAKGELKLDATQEPTELYHTLVSLPRIGTWTAHYFMMRLFNHPDL